MAFDRKDYGMNKNIPFIKIANRVEVNVSLQWKRVSGPPPVFQYSNNNSKLHIGDKITVVGFHSGGKRRVGYREVALPLTETRPSTWPRKNRDIGRPWLAEGVGCSPSRFCCPTTFSAACVKPA